MTGGDYDEDLPDISIIGDGSYNFPAAQRAPVNALAAQIRDQSQRINGASTSRSSVPRAPGPPPVNAPRHNAPPPPHPTRNVSNSRASNGSVASSSRRSGAPGAQARPPQGRGKLAQIEAALAEYASQVPPTSTPAQNAGPSRASPAPGLVRAPSFGPQPPRNPAGPSSSVRGHQQTPRANGTRAQRPSSRGSGGAASVSPAERRQSTSAHPRQRTASPSIPPQQLPQQQRQQHQQRQPTEQYDQAPQPPQKPPPTQGSSERVLRIELEALRAQFEEVRSPPSYCTKQAFNIRAAYEATRANGEGSPGGSGCAVCERRRSEHFAEGHGEGTSFRFRLAQSP